MQNFLFKHEDRKKVLNHYEMLQKARAVIVSTGRADYNLWWCCWLIPGIAFSGVGPALFHDERSWIIFDTVLISSSITASICCYIWKRWIGAIHARSYKDLDRVAEYFDKFGIDIGLEGEHFYKKSGGDTRDRIDPHSTDPFDHSFDIDCDYQAAEKLFKKVYTEHRLRKQSLAGALDNDDPYWEWEYTIRSD